MAVVWLALFSVALTIIILYPPRRYAALALLAFFVVLPVAEFVPLLLLAEVAYLVRYGREALHQGELWVVVIAGGALLGSWMVLLRHYFSADVTGAPYVSRRHYLLPLVVRAKDVVQRRGIVFDPAHGLKLDVLSRQDVTGATAVVYVHGGGWVLGYRGFQGRPLLLHLAQRGFVCFAVDYRLSPRATFPDHIVDVKRALAWVRAHAAEYGANPERIVIAGNSAGGHLAALAALTPNYAAWQPGFENARTDVQACMCFYGIYDLEDLLARWEHRGLEWLWRFVVLKQPRSRAEALWQSASPAFHLKAGAPPFFLVHGTHDTLVPIAEARAFADKLRRLTRVELLEIQGAQHAFELAVSPRARIAVAAAERFLTTL